MKEKDIFDKIMQLSLFRKLEPFYRKNKEVLLYLFFGGLAFFVSIGTYALFNINLKINELIANVLSWIITVLFAFFTNRIWVFQSRTDGLIEFLKQMVAFYAGRVITLMLEELILLIFVTWLAISSMVVKIFAQVVVIVLNYVISKWWTFKSKT